MSLPVILSVPRDWTLYPPTDPEFLKGPAPGGNVQISLSMLDSMDDSHRAKFIAEALERSQADPREVQIRQLTSTNGMRILERVTYSRPAGDPADTSQATTAPSEQLSWNLTMFVPYEHKYIPCSFDLFNLTWKQYLDDEQFVESIVDTAEPGKFPAAQ